jgi:hypothetical protein
MKSIEANVRSLEEKNPNYGLILLFAEAINGKGYGEETITRNFNQLVPKSDYLPSEKKELIGWLVSIGKQSEDTLK